MTLTISAASGGNLCITTADTRRVMSTRWIDTDTGERGELDKSKVGKDITKLYKLTDYVFFSGGGNSKATDYIRGELKSRVSRDDDIESVGAMLANIILFLWFEIVDGDKVFTGDYSFLNYLDEPDDFAIKLNGFTKNGQNKFIYYISGGTIVDHVDLDKDEYSYIFWGVSPEYMEQKEKFMMVEGEMTADNMVNTYLKAHALLSYLQPNEVSHICDIGVMKFDQNTMKPKTTIKQYDVSEFYEELGLE